MKKYALAVTLAPLLFVHTHADKFINTGPGTVNTCDNHTQVGISVKDTDSLKISQYATLMLGTYQADPMVGARLQLNQPATNAYSKAAFFDNYTTNTNIPLLRILAGTNAGSQSWLSHWNLSNGDFHASGKISTAVGFWVNNTQLNVPDYVFEDDYSLRSLKDTEAFIRANKHLPDVPSAHEIQRDGMNLAEMNLILLKKIEELTLHVIEQDKKIQVLGEMAAAEKGGRP